MNTVKATLVTLSILSSIVVYDGIQDKKEIIAPEQKYEQDFKVNDIASKYILNEKDIRKTTNGFTVMLMKVSRVDNYTVMITDGLGTSMLYPSQTLIDGNNYIFEIGDENAIYLDVTSADFSFEITDGYLQKEKEKLVSEQGAPNENDIFENKNGVFTMLMMASKLDDKSFMLTNGGDTQVIFFSESLVDGKNYKVIKGASDKVYSVTETNAKFSYEITNEQLQEEKEFLMNGILETL